MEDLTREGSVRGALEPIEQLTIAVARGKDAGKLIELGAGATASVGTAEDNDLRLADPTVSRYHLELVPTPQGIRVTDLGSTNGTFLGGTRIFSAAIPRGSQLRIGETTLVVDAAAAGERVPLSSEALPGLVMASDNMRELARRVRVIAKQSSAVLVQGETGAGKELVTRAVHDLSSRAAGPFIVVDCGALPAALLEAELFGHEKGAFTNADRARAGAFERADGGSLFLDEIGELPSPAQAALLGVLERQRFRRVGGEREHSVSVRILSATNRDLRTEVNRGTFRADLYYRLASARLVIPPLRDRVGDVSLLARHFARELSGTDDALDPSVLEALEKQSWPGNVRELRAVVERVVAFGPSEIGLESPAGSHAEPPPDSEVVRYRDAKAAAVAAFDRGYLTQLLQASKNNVSEAARRAQMDRPYLIALLKRHGIR